MDLILRVQVGSIKEVINMKNKPWENSKFFYCEIKQKDNKFLNEIEIYTKESIKKTLEELYNNLEDIKIVKLFMNGKEVFVRKKEIEETLKKITYLEVCKLEKELSKKEEVKEKKKLKI